MGVISVAGREQDKHCRVEFRLSSPARGDEGREAAVEGHPSDALLRFVRALARAAAIADYEREASTSNAGSVNESGDLRKI
jgi:hypothetical protein